MNSSNCWEILNAISTSMHSLSEHRASQLSTVKSPGLGRRSRNPEDKREIYAHSHPGLVQNLIGRVSNKGAAERALGLWPQHNSQSSNKLQFPGCRIRNSIWFLSSHSPCQAAQCDQATLLLGFLSSRGDTNHSLQALCNAIQPGPALLLQLLQLSLQAGLPQLQLSDHLCSLLGHTLPTGHSAARLFAPQHQPAQTMHSVLLGSTEGCESSQFQFTALLCFSSSGREPLLLQLFSCCHL